jgi:hypothetical protein
MRERHGMKGHWDNGLKKKLFNSPLQTTPGCFYSNTPVLQHSNAPVLNAGKTYER